MVHAAANQPIVHAVHLVDGTQSGATHGLGEEVRALAAASKGRIQATTFYECPRPQDQQDGNYDMAGLITPDWLVRNTPMAGADYFLCGPRSFLRDFAATLLQCGVPASQIHYKFFGPTDELLAA